MKLTLFALPSGGTVNLTNFVAIVPLKQTNYYQLLFAGLSEPLTIDSDDADAVKVFLSDKIPASSLPEDSYGSINLRKTNALDLMKARIAKHQNISDEEDTQNAELFERLKKRIDSDRPLGQKLYL
jgi:hypothetical protein